MMFESKSLDQTVDRSAFNQEELMRTSIRGNTKEMTGER